MGMLNMRVRARPIRARRLCRGSLSSFPLRMLSRVVGAVRQCVRIEFASGHGVMRNELVSCGCVRRCMRRIRRSSFSSLPLRHAFSCLRCPAFCARVAFAALGSYAELVFSLISDRAHAGEACGTFRDGLHGRRLRGVSNHHFKLRGRGRVGLGRTKCGGPRQPCSSSMPSQGGG